MIEYLYNKFIDWLHEDIPFWDLTTETLINTNIQVKAAIIANSRSLVACTED